MCVCSERHLWNDWKIRNSRLSRLVVSKPMDRATLASSMVCTGQATLTRRRNAWSSSYSSADAWSPQLSWRHSWAAPFRGARCWEVERWQGGWNLIWSLRFWILDGPPFQWYTLTCIEKVCLQASATTCKPTDRIGAWPGLACLIPIQMIHQCHYNHSCHYDYCNHDHPSWIVLNGNG